MTCFSITLAPAATAAIATFMPGSCPEKPTLQLYLFLNVSITFKSISLNLLGYEEVHCNKIILSVFFFNKLKATSTSS